MTTTDRWAQWLLNRRDGDSDTLRARTEVDLAAFRDGVLRRADLRPDDVVLDVGCGTGLIALGALARLGPSGRVIFTDISDDVLDECRRLAGDDPRCRFVRASAEELTLIDDASVDVVTTRSVLIYTDRKDAAFREFFRVLRPGGRLSIFEPINRFLVDHGPHRLFGLPDSPSDHPTAAPDRTKDCPSDHPTAAPDRTKDCPVDDLLAKIGVVFRDFGNTAAAQAMVDFDERDLLSWAEAAGFGAFELDYRAQLRVPAEPILDWPALKDTAPNPLVPTYGEAIAAVLTPQEQERLDAYLQGMVDAETPTRRTLALAYLRALRP